MVDCLDAYDSCLEGVIVRVCVPEELELGGGGAHEENLVGSLQSVRHLTKKSLGIVGVIFGSVAPLRLSVDVVFRRVDRRFVEIVRVDVKHPRFRLVDPDDRVLGHGADI
jgi:hypothetical protein